MYLLNCTARLHAHEHNTQLILLIIRIILEQKLVSITNNIIKYHFNIKQRQAVNYRWMCRHQPSQHQVHCLLGLLNMNCYLLATLQNDSAISQSPSGTSFQLSPTYMSSQSLDNSSTSNDVNFSSATPHLCPVTSTPAEPSVVHTEDMLDNVKKALGHLDFHLDF